MTPPLSEREYRSRPGWSQSQLKLLPDSPEEFWGYHVGKIWQFEPPAYMELGVQLHSVLLEKQELLIIPKTALAKDGSRRGASWELWKANHPDNYGVKEQDRDRIDAMCAACMADPQIEAMLENDDPVEESLFWTDEETGLPCKGRLDKIVFGSACNIIPDLKSTSIDPSDTREVAKKIHEFGYHRQGAFYCDAAERQWGKPCVFVPIFVQNKAPFVARSYRLSNDAIELGRSLNHLALRDLRRRLDSDDWTGNGFGQITEIDLPKYAYTDATG